MAWPFLLLATTASIGLAASDPDHIAHVHAAWAAIGAVSATKKILSQCDASKSYSEARKLVTDTATGAVSFTKAIVAASWGGFWEGLAKILSEQSEAHLEL